MMTGVVVSLVVWLWAGAAAAAAFAFACAWSLLNIHLLRILARFVALDPRKHKLRIALMLLLKVPVLYAAAYLVIRTGRLPAAGLLAGFGWPLLVITLKAAGRLVLGLDDAGRSGAGTNPGAVRRGD
jgi:hypothetical protein